MQSWAYSHYEPTLNHVCMWTPDGWQRVTAEESDGKEGLYMCELCGQAVIFAEGPVNVRHFRHWPKDYKYCPERRIADGSGSQYVYFPKVRPLAIRLALRRNGFGFELEMPKVPRDVLDENSSVDFVITAFVGSRVLQKFTHSVSYLNEDTTTFCDVGDSPSETYVVRVQVDPTLSWSRTTEGIAPEKGGLFNYRTHIYIHHVSDSYTGNVKAGEVYYLLTREEYPDGVYKGVEIEYVAEYKGFWIYEVIARNLSRDSEVLYMKSLYPCDNLTTHTDGRSYAESL